MKKLVLSVFATIAVYALLYVTWSFAYWDFNPKDWEMESRVLYCYTSIVVSIITITGIILCGDKKN